MHDAKYQQSAEQVCAWHGKMDTYMTFLLSTNSCIMYKESIKINELENKLLSSQISLSDWTDKFSNLDDLQGKGCGIFIINKNTNLFIPFCV
jgi:hypothetical protein